MFMDFSLEGMSRRQLDIFKVEIKINSRQNFVSSKIYITNKGKINIFLESWGNLSPNKLNLI